MLKPGRVALFVLPFAGWSAVAAAQPARVFTLACHGEISSGSEERHTRATRPWSGRIGIDLDHRTWRLDGGPARPLLNSSEDGASLTAIATPGRDFASSVRWVKGDAHYVGFGGPDLTVIRADCTAEDPAGRPLPLPTAR